MLFHVVPKDIFQAPAMHRRPFYIRPHPTSQNDNTRTHGMWNEAILPLLMASGCRNAGESDCCRKRRATEYGQKQCGKKQCVRKTEESTKQLPEENEENIIATYDFRGFAPDQIKVKVTDKAVIIRGESKDSHSSVQVTKSLPLPQGADKTGVLCQYVDGHVIVQIPHSERSHLEEKAERNEKPVEVSLEEKDETRKSVGDHQHGVTCSGEQDDISDPDRKMQAEFENSVKKLTGLFSTIFGLQFDGKEVEKSSDNDKEKSDKDAIDHENVANTPTSDTEKDVHVHSCPDKTEKAGTITHADGCEENADSKCEVQCENRDTDETCLMLKYDEKLPLKDVEDDFVRVEKTDTDDGFQPENTIHADVESDVAEPVMTDAGADDTKVTHNLTNNTTEDITDYKIEKEFKVQFDLSKYNPESIRVVFRDGYVIVEADREIEADNHSEVEKMSRRIRLPEKVDEFKLKSVLDAEGMLSIRAPFISEEEQKWRIISVMHEDS